QKREEVEARETTPPEYRNVIADLETRVRAHDAGIDASMNKFNAHSDVWVAAAAKLVLDLRVRMEGVLAPEARAAMADPAKAAQLGKEIAEWGKVTEGLGDVLNGLLVYPADRRLAVFDAAYYRKTYADLRTMSDDVATDHWLNHGLSEGRQSSSSFSIQHYWDRNGDVRQVFGSKANALNHWFDHGQREGRSPVADGSKPFPSTPNAAQAAEMVKRVMDAANSLNKSAKAL
ncbi:MAG: hypothetical protein ACKVQR_11825, partial [Aquabacterium sp.]